MKAKPETAMKELQHTAAEMCNSITADVRASIARVDRMMDNLEERMAE